MNDLTVPSQYKAAPYKQALVVFMVCLLLMGITRVFNKGGELEWAIAIIGIMFFAWVNPMLNIFHDKWLAYVGQSVLLFIGLIVGLLFLAKALSPDRLADHKNYRIMVPMSIVFFVMTTIVSRVIKFIYRLADQKF